MRENVSIKLSKYGLRVFLNPDIPFSELLEDVREKFSQSAKFFSNVSLAASFENRILTEEEEQEIVNLITSIAQINIICILDCSETTEQAYRQIVERYDQYQNGLDGQFYRGDLKRNQVVEFDTSVTILGDVEYGAKILSKGNIVVLGTLSGSAYAGIAGDRECFITALTMNPKVLKIADVVAKRHNLHKTDDKMIEPKIAIIDGEHIYIDPLI